MNLEPYLKQFQHAALELDKERLHKKQLEVATGVVLNSAFLKLYKKSWATPFQDPMTAVSRIFFSAWLNEKTLKEQKLCYNIQLRKLDGYAIESRKFAEVFRKSFGEVKQNWKNVRIDYGPLTLMEGWVNVDPLDLRKELKELANNFVEIDYLVDQALDYFRR